MTLGCKNRNPLNIRWSASNNWVGQRGSYKGFCVFNSTKFGYRAALILLRNYVRSGCDTIKDIIARWAPETENDVNAYVKSVCSSMGCTPEDKIVNTTGLCMLCSAMAHVESGIVAPDVLYLRDICDKYRISVEPQNRSNYGRKEK